MGASLHVGLVHYPVLDRQRLVVATSTVNYDLHDLARAARTYGVAAVHVITPLRSQVVLIERLVEHWTQGFGAGYNPSRREALELLCIEPSIEAAIQDVSRRCGGRRPIVLGTSARRQDRVVSFAEVRRRLEETDTPHFILFGTGWGMAAEALSQVDAVLAPGTRSRKLQPPLRAGSRSDRAGPASRPRRRGPSWGGHARGGAPA